MVLTATYYSPAVPGDAGFSINLAGDNRPRLGNIQGLITECELGAVGISSLTIDDPNGDVGNDSDAILGLKQLRVTESAAPAGKRRIWTGYIGDRTYARGGSDSPSLLLGPGRIIDMTLVDINSFLSFRVFVDDAANRPAETDVERIAWLLGYEYLSTTIFDNGLVSTAEPVDMDATDYKGQTSNDVLNDCAQQSGKNFFVYYDDSGSGEFSLFYDFNDSAVYLTDARVSNVLDDVDLDADQVATGPIWPPFSDSTLTRDPSRVVAGVYIPNGSNSVYRTRPATAITFGWRDGVSPAPSLTTVTAMNARADRYLEENATEDDLIKFSVRFPAENVNDWREGQAGQVKFSHLPGYEDWRWVRALRRETQQPDATDQSYVCNYECTPMVGRPQAAFHHQEIGLPYSGVPILLQPTTPGRLLIAVVMVSGNTSQFPADTRFLDDPPITGSPPIPPYPDHAGWTYLGQATTDYGGMNIGGPGAGYTPGGGTETAGLLVSVAFRRVQPGEITTHPVAVSGDDAHNHTAIWLWEIDTPSDPVFVATKDDHVPSNPAAATMPSATGNLLTAIVWPTAAGHSAIPTPVSTAFPSGVELQSGDVETNNPAVGATGAFNWGTLVRSPLGGVASATLTVNPAYTSLNYAAIQVALPPGVKLVPIPYPANAVAT